MNLVQWAKHSNLNCNTLSTQHVDSINASSSLQNGSDNSYGEGLEDHNGQSTTDVDSGSDDESDSELGMINKYESQYSVSTA